MVKVALHLLPVNHSGMEVWGTSMERLSAVVLILSIYILTCEDNLTPPQSENVRASKISIPVTPDDASQTRLHKVWWKEVKRRKHRDFSHHH